ncbi:hypothetical protein CEXT_331771 [Caerostris extrusa]|uniref:Uncharacterized protein n=1 Tax=Caerostris extrusa TaxID=172846 RepID=A0AAV4TEV8_CAEEX|nr:hypothetical protein CEXT_331771 [Caerostris extrusa]
MIQVEENQTNQKGIEKGYSRIKAGETKNSSFLLVSEVAFPPIVSEYVLWRTRQLQFKASQANRPPHWMTWVCGSEKALPLTALEP